MSEKLDLENVRIFKQENMAEAISLIGQKVYMSDYEDFFHYYEYEFVGFNYIKGDSYAGVYPFIGKDKDGAHRGYKYFILAKDVKIKQEKVLRPYKDLDEFECRTRNHFTIGESVLVRNKETKRESELIYNGYFVNDANDLLIYLGGIMFTLETLTKYEFVSNHCESDEWLSFGVIE